MQTEHQTIIIGYCVHCGAKLFYDQDNDKEFWQDSGFDCGRKGHKEKITNQAFARAVIIEVNLSKDR